MGVEEQARSRGIGKALLLSCLQAMYASGYTYAIVSGTDVPNFLPYRERENQRKGVGDHAGAHFIRRSQI